MSNLVKEVHLRGSLAAMWAPTKRKINHAQLIAKRSEMQQKTAEKLGRRSKDHFKVGDKVLCQNMKTMK